MSITCCEHAAYAHKPGCMWCEDKHEVVMEAREEERDEGRALDERSDPSSQRSESSRSERQEGQKLPARYAAISEGEVRPTDG